MSEFCQQCSVSMFGEDHKELAGLSTEEDTKQGLFCVAICEGCGIIQVDHNGRCITVGCLENHNQ